jgi:hypothetical protein
MATAAVAVGLAIALNGCAGSDAGVSSTASSEPAPTTSVLAVAVGSTVTVEQVEVTVVSSEVTDAVSDGLARGRFLVAQVRLENTSTAEVPYAPRSWTLAPEGADPIEAYPIADTTRLSFGTLAAGGSISGQVGFDVAGVSGPAQLEYRPPATEAVRAGWSVTL